MKKESTSIIFKIVLICIILLLLFWNLIGSNWQVLTEWLYPKETDKNARSLQLIFSVIGGIVIILGLYLSYLRVTSLEKSVRIQQKTQKGQNKIIKNQTTEIELSRKSQINEQFKIAVEHLGNSNKAVVIGGLIELIFIAEEDPEKYAEIVHKLFCSYLRSEASMKKENIDVDFYLVENILKFLFNSTILKNKKSDLSNLNFKECSFENIEFKNVNFSECYMPLILKNCTFENCCFNNAKFINPNIKSRFIKAFKKESDEANKVGILLNIKFKKCKGSLVYFYFYDIINIEFIDCDNFNMFNFYHCFLHNILGNIFKSGSQHFFSEFINIEFSGRIDHVSFYCCDFQNIDFSNSEIINCELAYCKFSYSITENDSSSLQFRDNRIIEPRFDPKYYYKISFVPLKEFLDTSTNLGIQNHPFYKHFSGNVVVGNSNEEYISQITEKYFMELKEIGI